LAGTLVSVAGLVGRPVRDAQGKPVGRLVDVVVRAEADHPPVAGFVVRIGERRCWLHADAVSGVEQGHLTIVNAHFDLTDVTRRPGEILLVDDIIDHQLVDVRGVRVVRASDLYLANVGSAWHLVGVDVTWLSFLRRALPGARGRRPSPAQVLDWAGVHSLAVAQGAFKLNRTHDGLKLLSPGELAELLDDLGRSERLELLDNLDAADAADTLEALDDDDSVALLRDAAPERAAELLAHMERDEAIDVLRDLDHDEREQVMSAMQPEQVAAMRALLAYDENTAGGIMTSDLVRVGVDATVATAVAELRAAMSRPDRIEYVVLVDSEGSLVDDVSAVELLGVDPATLVSTLIAPPYPVSIPAGTPLDEVVEEMADNRGASMLVVDAGGRPIGRILPDDIVDAMGRDEDRRWPWQRDMGN
jgi:CBS domain-containing protein